MSTLAVDLSNYSDPLTPAAVQALKDAGVELAICQAVDPPAPFPPTKTRAQIQACLEGGLQVDVYVWLWFDLTEQDIRNKMLLVADLPIRQVWLDVEDTAAIKYDQATCEAKVAAALAVCDGYPGSSGDPTGVYSGRWFWADRRYLGNTTAFSDRELWDANYDDVADASVGFVPYGGWTAPRIKQYRGTTSLAGIGGLDLNVLSVDEAAELEPAPAPPEPTDPCAAIANDRNGLVSSLGLIAGDRLAPVAKQKTSSAAVRALVATIRGEADAHGIQHA